MYTQKQIRKMWGRIMDKKLTDAELDDLIDRLSRCVREMREEARTTRYPDRAEQLPEMTDRLNQAIVELRARKTA